MYGVEVVFFFQAEDGIRDADVTGVQTCALPICSTLTGAGSRMLFEVLEAGAVDVLPKPRVDTRQFLLESTVRVCDAVRAAARAKLRGSRPPRQLVEAKLSADAVLPPPVPGRVVVETDRIVCIGAST